MNLQQNSTGSPARPTIPAPTDPQAYYKLLVGGPKRPGETGERAASLAPTVLSAAFREVADRAGRRLAEARRRLAA